MPLYMDRHNVPGITLKDAATAHQMDLKVQEEFGCNGITYWVDEERGNAFCLIEAPDIAAVKKMHNKAHGLIPHEIIEVDQNIVKAFLGRIQDPGPTQDPDTGEMTILCDPAFRALLVIDIQDKNLLATNFNLENSIFINTAFNQIVLDTINKHKGRIVNRHNAFLISFSSVTNATACALSILKKLKEKFSAPAFKELNFKIGLSAGVPVDNNDEIFGDTIKASKALAFISKSDQIFCSAIIKELFKGKSLDVFGKTKEIFALTVEDEKFIVRLFSALEKINSYADLKLESLSKDLNISKSQLYRKMVKLTRMSPNEFVKEYKLQRSTELILNKGLNVSETSYELGFTNPSYFTKCFKKRFGILPGHLIKKES